MQKDHSKQTEYGHYMFVERNQVVTEATDTEARLVSIENNFLEPKCLGFYYTMSDATDVNNKLSVFLDLKTSSYPIWTKQTDTGRRVNELFSK